MRRRRTAATPLMLLIPALILLMAVAAPRRPVPYLDHALRTSYVPMPTPLPQMRRVAVTATAYSSTKDQTWGDPFMAYCGPVGPGTVALSRDLFHPDLCGATVYLDDRAYVVNDKMGSGWRNRVDVWMPSRGAALRHGVRRRVVLEVPQE